MKVIGICGTNGSGKGTVAKYLLDLPQLKGKIKYISTRTLLIEKAAKENIEITDRTSMKKFADRHYESGKGFILDFINENIDSNILYVWESIRRPKEIYDLRSSGIESVTISVDADINTRYERVKIRKSQTDSIDFERFVHEENVESLGVIPHEQNIKKCMELSDIKLTNNHDEETFKSEIKEKVLILPIFNNML